MRTLFAEKEEKLTADHAQSIAEKNDEVSAAQSRVATAERAAEEAGRRAATAEAREAAARESARAADDKAPVGCLSDSYLTPSGTGGIDGGGDADDTQDDGAKAPHCRCECATTAGGPLRAATHRRTKRISVLIQQCAQCRRYAHGAAATGTDPRHLLNRD